MLKCIIRSFLLFATLVSNLAMFGQHSDEIEKLKKERAALKIQISQIEESIRQIDSKITNLESKSLLKRINDSSLTAFPKSGALLRSSPNTKGEILHRFKGLKEIILLSYKDEYFQACFGNMCGYVNRYYLKDGIELSEVFTKQTNPKKSYSSKRTISPKHSNYTKKSYSRSRTYYRGPRGGCYYINSNGNKTYVARSMCR